MRRATPTEVGQAILTTLRAGTYNSSAIVANLADGGEVRPPAVLVASPSLGFDVLGEGFLIGASEWPLRLYSSNGREPSVGIELAFFTAVIEAFMASPKLGGVVSGAYLLGTDEPTPISTGTMQDGTPEPPSMYRRDLRLHVDH